LFKDLVPYPRMRCSMGARLFAAHVPAAGSPFTDRIDAAGLLTIGKTATSELGLLGSTETLLEGVTHNPWDLSRSAAGSSGGAAVAVASGMVPLAHASDGGGSVRIPASVCGVFGMKPSRGRTVPITAQSSDFGDLVSEGCISRTVRDSARFLSIVESRDGDLPPLGDVRGPSARRLRIGAWTRTLLGAEPEPAVRVAFDDAVDLCRSLGHTVERVEPPALDGRALSDGFFAVAGAAIVSLGEMMQGALGRPLGAGDLERFTRALADEVRARPGAVPAARAAFAAAAAAYVAVFERHDVVLTPTLAIVPWRLGWLSPVLGRAELVTRTEQGVGYTPIHNIAGVPAMSVPLHFSCEGLPIGTCFAARRGAEDVLFALAYELEEARPWRDRWPPFSYPLLCEEA
jgi:amidase